MPTEVKCPIAATAALALLSGLHCSPSVTVAASATHVSPGLQLAGPAMGRDANGLGALQPSPKPTPKATRVTEYWLSAGHDFEDTLRGDWDTSSALLVVYNSSWRVPLKRLLSFARSDLAVYVLATPQAAESREFQRWLAGMPFAGLVSIELDTPWIRDYGPIEVERTRGISWLDMIYAPGDRPLDDAVPTLLGEVFHTSQQREHFQLDGGGIISSGAGLCGITEASFEALELDIQDPERVQHFLKTVGCRTLARLPQLPLEATGHVDMVAQFLSPHQVAIAVPVEESPPALKEALNRARSALSEAGRAHGQELEFVELPIVSHEDRYYSYVNGLRTPSHYFVPSYSKVDRKLEAEIYRRLAGALHGIKVVDVDSDEMIESGGAIHCVTLGLKRPLVPHAAEARTRL